ncbi:polysaccharide biosynthesis/export family protein [Salinihabitans flavidus]|uniref:polysaccharide biosynthesis/export family protein n=1 Tax=Salinihabitans flavidus TaxID=569882 RepID=UPI0031833D7A
MGLLAFATLFLAACSLPRGAALQSEIVATKSGEEASFVVEPVTRANLPRLKQWPATGWKGHYRWFEARPGPASSVIRKGDRVKLTIWDNQENSLLTSNVQKNVEISNIVVSSSGTIFVPYVGEVLVRGMTPDDARAHLQKELSGIASTAQVQLEMQSGQYNSVDLVGGVAKPGSVPLPDRNFTLLSLLAEGGGISPALNNPLVRLIRDRETYEIRASDLFSDSERNVTLRGGDKVIVEEDERYFIALGATGTQRLVSFETEKVMALEALSMLGGLNEGSANPQGILVLREYPETALRQDGTGPEKTEVIFTIDLTSADGLFAARKFEIHPHDTVMATESPFRSARTIMSLFGVAFGLANQAQ